MEKVVHTNTNHEKNLRSIIDFKLDFRTRIITRDKVNTTILNVCALLEL